MIAAHYYGDVVRVLLVVSAVVVFLLEFTIHDLPFSSSGVIALILVLVVAAGITNPAQLWIHWANLLIIAGNLIVFGSIALERFNVHSSQPTHAVLYALVSLIFLVNLYFATRTLRGLIVGSKPPIH